MSSLSIYRASAGSGKTFQLTRNFLELLFRAEENYSSVLAVTFTNKAASQLKEKILEELVLISSNRTDQSLHFEYLSQTFKRGKEILIPRAKKILRSILENYSQFSVGTIDEFFQQILRSFARDLGLHSGYTVELNAQSVIEEAVQRIIEKGAEDSDLFDWIFSGVAEKIEDGKTWKSFEKDLIDLGKELLSEKVSALLFVSEEALYSRQAIFQFRNKLLAFEKGFEKKMKLIGSKAETVLKQSGLSVNDFSGKGSGPAAALVNLNDGTYDLSKKTRFVEDQESWVVKSLKQSDRQIRMNVVEESLYNLLKEAYQIYSEHYQNYLLSISLRKDLFRLGLFTALAKEIQLISQEQGIFLIGFTNPVIAELVRDNPAPFIYERTGHYFQYYMIDEFQDTSDLQWNNFLPLIREAIASEGKVVLVGDAKQSIYRWRNSNWQLIASVADTSKKHFQSQVYRLDKNYRSRQGVIDFNNVFFAKAVGSVLSKLESELPRMDTGNQQLIHSIRDIYEDVKQEYGQRKEGGFVSVDLIENNKTGGFPDYFSKLAELVGELQIEQGYAPGDIVFLVRRNQEATELIRFFKSTELYSARQDVNYELISAESLEFSGSPIIRSIISVFRLMKFGLQISDLSELATNLELSRNGRLADEFLDLMATRNMEEIIDYCDLVDLVDQFSEFESQLLSVCIEKIIRLLRLSELSGAASWLMSFKEQVNSKFKDQSIAKPGELLDWWDFEGSGKQISMDDQLNTMRVMTIHKAKGLEFPVVIIPGFKWNFDHSGRNAPYLWVSTKDTLFDELPVLPIKYRKDMLGSDFSFHYEQEKIQTWLDNLNLIYVAFTRAIDRLHVFIPESDRRTFHSGDLVSQVVFDNPDIRRYEFGDVNTRRNKPEQRQSNTEFVELVQGKSLTFGAASTQFDSDEMVRGRAIHRELEQYDGRAIDIDPEIAKRIDNLVSDHRIKMYFDDSGEVMNEPGIFSPEHGLVRPDRIVHMDDHTAVIEYKTGEKKLSHNQQVKKYCEALENMGYRPVKGFLVYVDLNVIEQVVQT